MILVTEQRHWISPEQASRTVVEWGVGVTPRALAPDWLVPGRPWAYCALDGMGIQAEQWDLPVPDGSHLFFSIRPGVETAFIIPGLTAKIGIAAAAPSLFSFAVPFLKAFALSLISNALLAPGKPHAQKGKDDGSATYAFLNLQSNERAEGMPIPVVYGLHRVAPPVINQSTRNWLDANGDPQSEVLFLFLVSEGPIEAIGDKVADGGPFSLENGNQIDGLQIDNQPAENFNEVEAWVRLGSNDQDPIDEFAEPVQQFDVGSVLRESGDTVNVEVTSPGVFSAGDTEITKWDTQVGYTMGDDADEFTAVVTFYSGLYKINGTTGALEDNAASFQARYRKVDGSGVPYGDYIVLPKEPDVVASRSGTFSVEYPHKFYETTGYTAPAAGHYLSVADVNTTGGIYTIDSSSIEEKEHTQFSWMGWVRSDGTYSTLQEYAVFDWWDEDTSKGFWFKISGANAAQADLRFKVGDGSTTTLYEVRASEGYDVRVDGLWHHIAVTYSENYDTAGNTRARIFIDGNKINEWTGPNARALYQLSESLCIGSRYQAANTFGWRGGLDDCAFFNREVTPFEIASKWNQGQQNAPTFSGEETDLIVAFQLDTMVLAFGIYYSPEVLGPGKDTSASGLNLGASGTDPKITTGTDTGIVAAGESGTRSTDKFLIEIQRIEPEDTRQRDQDEATWSTVQLRTFEAFEYPSCALLAVKVRATDQLDSPTPLVTALVKGKHVPVWDGVDANFPAMNDGYSRNPSWIAADMLTRARYGMGAFYEPKDLDLNQFQAFADWCDELVFDGQEKVALNSAAVLTAGTGDVASWTVDVFEYRIVSLPPNFIQPTAGIVTGSDVYIRAEGTTASPSFPSWMTSQVTASAAEVQEVVYDPALSLYRVRVASVDAATGSTYTMASGDYEVQNYEPRMRYDGVYDRRDRPAWDALLQMLTTARAVPMRIGAHMSIFYDDSRTAVALIGMGSIIEGTFKLDYTDAAARPNAEEVEFLDAKSNYERTTVVDEHPDLTDPTLQSSFRWRRLKLEGITRETQVRRHMRRDLNVFNLLRRTVEFDVGIDSLAYLPGDRIALAHDVPVWGTSGRIWADTPDKQQLSEWIDWTLWDKGSDSETPTATATVGPLGYGAVYELSTKSTAASNGRWSLDAGSFPALSQDTIFSIWIKEGTASTVELSLKDDDNAVHYWGVFQWVGGSLSISSTHSLVSSAVSLVGSGWYRIEINTATVTANADAARSARVFVPHRSYGGSWPNKDIEVWGPLLQDSTATAAATPAMQVTLDRSVTILSTSNYQIQVENAASNTRETVRVNTIATPAGTYSAGSAITMSAAGFSFLPAKDDEYAFGTVSAGETEDYSIIEVSLNPRELRHKVRAVEYNEAVYGDNYGTLEGQKNLSTPSSGSTVIPPGVHSFGVTEETVTGPDGSVTIGAAIAFTHYSETYHAVWETRIYVATGTIGTTLATAELVATLPRTRTFHRILNFIFRRRQSYTIYAQPVTRTGAGQYRSFVSYVEFTPNGLAEPPLAPTSPRGIIAGQQVLYRWDDPGDIDRVKAIELRRGGWILGQHVATLPAGTLQYGPTSDWVGAPTNSKGEADPPVYLRSRLGTGQASPVATLSFAPSVIGAEGDSLETSREDASWAGTLSGLTTYTPPAKMGAPTPLAILIPSGGGTTHTYTFTGSSFSTSVPVYLQIGVVAVQEHPATISQLSSLGGVGERNMGRWTVEGPLVHLDGDPGLSSNCSLTVEVAHSPSASAGSDFREYRPGVYNLRSYKVRVSVTRPSTDYSFQIRRVSVRATKVQADRPDRIAEIAYSPS